MKKQFINDLNIGDTVDDVFVLSEKFLSRKKDGNPFLNITLSDKTGSMKGVVWDNVDQIISQVSSGDLVHVKGNVSEYKGTPQLVIKALSTCTVESGDSSDFIPATGRDVENMFERILKLGASIETEYLKKLLAAFWRDEAFVAKFKSAPAAKKMHHAYLGGLLEHSLSMGLLADQIAAHYSGINRDLLLAGAILHDIGKIEELEYQFKIDYSDEGRLLSHIIIGIRMIEEKLKEIREFPEEQALLLKHMIVSHHGTREFGSPEPPKTIEAVLLYYIDDMDAKVNGIRHFISEEDQSESWTSFHRLLDRHFYIGKI
jgi:3'-5' exoribonuclease